MVDMISNLIFFAGMLIYLLYASIGKHRTKDMVFWGIVSLFPVGLICLLLWGAAAQPALYFWTGVVIFIFFGLHAITMLPYIDETDALFYSLMLLYSAFSLPWPSDIIACGIVIIPLFISARYALSDRHLSFRQKIFMYSASMLSLGLIAAYQLLAYSMNHERGWTTTLISGMMLGYAAMQTIPVAGILLHRGNDRITYATKLMANFSDRQMARPTLITIIIFAMLLVLLALLETDSLQVISWSFIIYMAFNNVRMHS